MGELLTSLCLYSTINMGQLRFLRHSFDMRSKWVTISESFSAGYRTSIVCACVLVCMCVFSRIPARQRDTGHKSSGLVRVTRKHAGKLLGQKEQEGQDTRSRPVGTVSIPYLITPFCWPGCRRGQSRSTPASGERGLLRIGARTHEGAWAGPTPWESPPGLPSFSWKPSGGPRSRSPGEASVMPSSTESLSFQKEKIGGRKNKRKQDALCQSLC